MAGIENLVLSRITPTKAEHAKIDAVKEKVISATEKILAGSAIEYTLAGSFMRDTYMLDKKEFDIFLLFPESISRGILEHDGLKIGKRIISSLKGSYKIAYAEHPYVRGRVSGFSVDIVPAYKVASAAQIKSAVDRTPFHNRYLAEHLSSHMVPHVRLCKQFLKANGLYGSDARTEGFSGYLCELLIVYYKTFNSLISNIARWKPQVYLDIQSHFQGDIRKFSGQPLVVIDPVDSNRNVASVLSHPNFTKLVYLAKNYRQRPSLHFFFPQGKNVNLKALLTRRSTHIFALSFKAPDIIEDTLYPQLRKTAQRLVQILQENDFSVVNHTAYLGENCLIIFELQHASLPPIRKITGPSIFSEKNCMSFIEKYKSSGRIYVQGDVYVAEVKRKFLTAEKKLAHSIAVPQKTLLAKGIATHIAPAIKSYSMLSLAPLAAQARKDHALEKHLADFFTKNFY